MKVVIGDKAWAGIPGRLTWHSFEEQKQAHGQLAWKRFLYEQSSYIKLKNITTAQIERRRLTVPWSQPDEYHLAFLVEH